MTEPMEGLIPDLPGPSGGVREEWGMQCPRCGSSDHLEIEVRKFRLLTVGGTDDAESGDEEWDGDSAVQCRNHDPKVCNWGGTVRYCEQAYADAEAGVDATADGWEGHHDLPENVVLGLPQRRFRVVLIRPEDDQFKDIPFDLRPDRGWYWYDPQSEASGPFPTSHAAFEAAAKADA